MKSSIYRLKTFLILWSSQALSALGSEMTAYALRLWLYEETGSALQTSLLSIFTYAPYIAMSIFAGALSDKWDKKKIMLTSDAFAAFTTISTLILLKTGLLCPIHLYILNAVNGLMNTIQQPASEVAMTMIVSKEDYPTTSGLNATSRSLITILHPIFATTLYAFGGMDVVILIDLSTFALAFLSLLFFIKIPHTENMKEQKDETIVHSAKVGLTYLKETPLILTLILFLSGVNFVASTFDAILPAFVLPKKNGGAKVLGILTSCAGIATLLGSLIHSILPKPKDRVRVIYITMLFSLSIENFILAFCNIPFVWYIAQILGWIVVPIMSANLDIILRSTIPVNMQGRVYACRNTLQFFTIPIGLFLGGYCVDKICEPFMENISSNSFWHVLFGSGKGSGSNLMMFVLAVLGTTFCLVFGNILKKYKFSEN